MGDKTSYTKRVGVTQKYSELSNLRKLSTITPDRFYRLARKWTSETIEALVNSFPPYVARDKQSLYDALSNAYAVLKNPLCETDDSLRLSAIQNAQSTLALVVQNILNNRASDKAEKSLVEASVTALKRVQTLDLKAKEYFALAITDDLTDCRNGRYFREKYASEILQAERYGRPLSIIVIDADHFKKINDAPALGHEAGDYVLRELAQTASKIMLRPEADTFAKYGGEEFAFLLPETEEHGAEILAERVRRAIETHSFVYEEKTIPVTISAGVAQYNPHDKVKLFPLADRCMYAAKESGRNKVVSVSGLRNITRQMMPAVGKEAIKKMFGLTDSWLEYFTEDPPSAPLNTTVIYRKEKEK